jgi:hypothetical protein
MTGFFDLSGVMVLPTLSEMPTSEKREKNFFTDGHKNSHQGCWEGWQLAIQLISLFCGSEHVPSFVICMRSQFHTPGTFYSDTYTNVWSHRPATTKPKSGHCPQMTTTRAIMPTPICPLPTPQQTYMSKNAQVETIREAGLVVLATTTSSSYDYYY